MGSRDLFGIGDPDAGKVFYELSGQAFIRVNAGWKKPFYLTGNQEGGEVTEDVVSSNQLV
jgi:hypothetical protein